MANSHPSQPPGEPEIAAWTVIIDAFEEALDTPELRAHDRGLIAGLYDSATQYIGEPQLQPDDVAAPSTQRAEFVHRVGESRGRWAEDRELVGELIAINAEMRA